MKGVFVWDRGVQIASKGHPYGRQIGTAKQMKHIFLASPSAVCWWCGRRMDWWGFYDLQADHIAQFVYWSPMAVACKRCNNKRKSVKPHPERLGRLFHSDDVVRDRDKTAMKEWCETQAGEIFGSYLNGIQVLLAKTGTQDVRNEDGSVCHTSNRMCEKVGFLPPRVE